MSNQEVNFLPPMMMDWQICISLLHLRVAFFPFSQWMGVWGGVSQDRINSWEWTFSIFVQAPGSESLFWSPWWLHKKTDFIFYKKSYAWTGGKGQQTMHHHPPHTHTQQTYQRVTASPSVSWKMAQLHSEGHGLGYMSLFEFQVQHL